MSFALYGESDGYVHLVAAEDRDEIIDLFIADLAEVNVDITAVFNVYAVQDNKEDKDLEDLIEEMIKAKQSV